jgi:hypothetical protein
MSRQCIKRWACVRANAMRALIRRRAFAEPAMRALSPSLGHFELGPSRAVNQKADESHYENHQRATELHDAAAHAHRVAEQQGKKITRRVTSIRGKLLSTRKRPVSTVARPKAVTASPRSDMMTSRPWRMSAGKPDWWRSPQ